MGCGYPIIRPARNPNLKGNDMTDISALPMIRYTNISQIRAANKAAGFFWFSPATILCFGVRVESRIYTSADGLARLWVESGDNFYETAREYKVATFNPETGGIMYADMAAGGSTVQRFTTFADAKAHILTLLDS